MNKLWGLLSNCLYRIWVVRLSNNDVSPHISLQCLQMQRMCPRLSRPVHIQKAKCRPLLDDASLFLSTGMSISPKCRGSSLLKTTPYVPQLLNPGIAAPNAKADKMASFRWQIHCHPSCSSVYFCRVSSREPNNHSQDNTHCQLKVPVAVAATVPVQVKGCTRYSKLPPRVLLV